MALFCRIKEMKSIKVFNNFKRFYFQIHTPRLFVNQTSIKPISDYYHYIRFTNAPKNQGFFDSRVRFFAAPVQVVPKKEVKELNRPRLNEEIKAEFIRLVTDEGHSVVSRMVALQRAKELQCDLVEVDKVAKPVVCRIMNYKRVMYKKQVKGKELAKIKSAATLKSASKEVRFSAKAELKDIKTKVEGVKRLMERGYRVKCTALAVEGRDLNGVLSQITALMEDVAVVESAPKIDEKQGFIIVRHIKYGLPKKGKKSSSGPSKVLSPVESESESEAAEQSNDNVDLDNKVEDPLQYQQGIAPLRSNDVRGTSKSQSPNFPPNATPAPQYQQGISPSRSNDVRGASKSQSPNFPPNVTPAPPLENRYARKVPNNAPPMRSPHFQGSPPVPRPDGSGGSSSRSPWPPRQNANSQHRDEIPNGASQNGNNFSPHIGNPRPPTFPRGDVPKSTSFGLFSEAKPNNVGDVPKSANFGLFSGAKPNNGRFESGVDVKGVNQQVSRGNTNPPKINSDGGAAGGHKKWGIFSSEK